MATYNQPKEIIISVDPGFDATKIVVNGIVFDVPNYIVDITGKSNDYLSINNDGKPEDYLISHYIEGKEYLIGELAKKSILEKSNRELQSVKKDMLDSINRFMTRDFEVNLLSCIAYGIAKYAKEISMDLTKADDANKFKVLAGVALPNDWVKQLEPEIKKMLAGDHYFEIQTQDGIFKINFTVNEKGILVASQAQCALLGLLYDDAGNNSDNLNVLDNLPAIIVDGGYKTIGIFLLTVAQNVASSESNTDFAMGNVHKKMAKIIREDYGRDNIMDFQIPALLENGGFINYLEEDTTGRMISKRLDLEELKNAELGQTCKELIDYLNEKFEDLLDVKSLIITGGTGAAYYNQIQTFTDEERSHLKGHLILTSYEFMGKKIQPVHAIAVGMYKVLKRVINAKRNQKSKKASE